MGKISIQELANVLVERKKMSKRDANAFVTAMFEIVQQHLESEKLVKIKGLGTFKIIDVEDRESVNVNTGERVLIEGHGKITYAPDSLLKELVNKPFSQFETVVLNEGVDFDDLATTTTDVPEPEIESEPVVAPETESVVEEDHSSMPLVDFGGAEEPVVEPEPIVEPEPEPKVIEEIAEEEIPEWVIEPVSVANAEPEPEPEPVSEPEKEPVVEPEPEIIEEPVVEEVPVIEPEPEVEPEPEPEPEMEAEPADEEESAEDEEEGPIVEAESEISETSGSKWFLALVALVIGLAGGYLLGNYYPYTKVVAPDEKSAAINVQETEVAKVEATEAEVKEAPAEEAAPVAEPAAEDAKAKEAEAQAKADAEKAAAEAKAKAEAEAKAKAEKEAKAKAEKEAKAKAEAKPVYNKYDEMDVRVRLGAYRIVGTDKVVKVKDGENLVKISRRILGPDMECYLEVYNNIKATTPLKVGQEIKIPKLELKKKKKAATAN